MISWLNSIDYCLGFGLAAITLVAFCFILLTNNNALNSYYAFYGPVSILLNYQILFNKVFPQALFESEDFFALFKILSTIVVIWMLYWGGALTVSFSLIRRKKYYLLLMAVLVIIFVNYFSMKFQEWFIGMRTVMG